jgi:hypothetical protein
MSTSCATCAVGDFKGVLGYRWVSTEGCEDGNCAEIGEECLKCGQERKSGPGSSVGMQGPFGFFSESVRGLHTNFILSIFKWIDEVACVGTLQRKTKDSSPSIMEIAARLQHLSADAPQTLVCMLHLAL